MNGAESLIQTLVDGGVEVCFSNPGTSEIHLVEALDRVLAGAPRGAAVADDPDGVGQFPVAHGRERIMCDVARAAAYRASSAAPAAEGRDMRRVRPPQSPPLR